MSLPALRFKDDNGMEFPEWDEKKLGEISSFFSGGTPLTTNKEFYVGEIPFIKSGEISKNKTEQFISEAGLNNSSAKMVLKGDLLYALYGATSGEVAISKIEGAINQAVLCIRSKLNTCFLLSYFLREKEYILQTYLQGGQGNLSAEIVKSLNVPVPSKDEQSKIANSLSAIDEKISQLTQKHELLNQYKKGVMQKIFSQELRFKDDDGSEFPEWGKNRIEELFLRSSHISKTEFIESEGNFYIVDMGSIGRDCSLIVTKATNHSADMLTTNDLVMAKDDIGGGNIIGKVVRIPEDNKYICGDHVYRLSLRKHAGCIGFFYYAINSYQVNKSFRKKANGTAQLGISNDTVDKQALPVPTLKEQTKIANFLTAIEDKITAAQSQLELVKQYKQGLLQQMFV